MEYIKINENKVVIFFVSKFKDLLISIHGNPKESVAPSQESLY
jgi:hypothetical protein